MIPLLVGAAALVIGGKGVKKTVSAVSKMNDAKDMAHRYERRAKRAEEKREKAREQAGAAIGQLGETKMNILTGSLQTFVKEFRRIKNVDFRNSVGLEELRDFRPDSPALKEIAAASQKALEFSTGAVEGGLAGGAMALGAYGAVGALATASTGTAITGLSGAAATNATLAWLGGGSLAAGGLGIAGGTAVLGGIVAAPALLVAGISWKTRPTKPWTRPGPTGKKSGNSKNGATAISPSWTPSGPGGTRSAAFWKPWKAISPPAWNSSRPCSGKAVLTGKSTPRKKDSRWGRRPFWPRP